MIAATRLIAIVAGVSATVREAGLLYVLVMLEFVVLAFSLSAVLLWLERGV